MLIGDLIRRRAAISPRQVFWREGEVRVTYERLERDANRVARALLAEDVRPGDHAAICSENSYAYAVAHFGAAKAGVVLAHLNPRYTAGEWARLAAHCEARVMWVGPSRQAMAEEVRPLLPGVRRWIALPGEVGTRPPEGQVPWLEWLAPHGDEPPEAAVESHGRAGHRAAAIYPESPFQLLYTSGTTGEPKGVLISHRAKLAHGATHAMNLGLLPGHRLWSALPLYHQFAQWLVLVSAPLAGAEVVAAPRFDPAACWEALRNDGITHLPAVPTMLHRLLDDPGVEGLPPTDLRAVVYGGAPIHAEQVRRLRLCFPGVTLFQGFGQTEIGYGLGLTDPEHNLRPDALGKPDIHSDIRLVSEEGRDVARGEVGEIVARTPYLMNGYFKAPAATEAFFAFGREWGRTGDLAWQDADGFYLLAGRKTDMIVSGGVNVYPREVEAVLLAHPDVADAAVFGVPHEDWGELVHAAVILHPGAEPEEPAIIAHAREHLAPFKCPKAVTFHDAFPRTHNGKTRKNELRRIVVGEGAL